MNVYCPESSGQGEKNNMEIPEATLRIGEVKSTEADCPVHGRFETYQSEMGIGECPKCAKERIEEERRTAQNERRRLIIEAKIRETFKRSSVPPIFKGISFDDYKPTCPEAEEVIKTLKQYVQAHERVIKGGKSILLHGNSGSGKTMMGVATLNEYMNRGYTALYMKSPAVVNWGKRAWVKNPEESQDQMIEKLLQPDIMLIDDIPKGAISERERQILWDVIDGRVSNLKPTITTSLFTKESLKEKVHEEVARRVVFRGAELHFSWPAYEEEGLF